MALIYAIAAPAVGANITSSVENVPDALLEGIPTV